MVIFDGPAVTGSAHVDGMFCRIDVASFDDLDFSSTELAIDPAAMSEIVFLNKPDLAPDTSAPPERATRGLSAGGKAFVAEVGSEATPTTSGLVFIARQNTMNGAAVTAVLQRYLGARRVEAIAWATTRIAILWRPDAVFGLFEDWSVITRVSIVSSLADPS